MSREALSGYESIIMMTETPPEEAKITTDLDEMNLRKKISRDT